MDWINYNHFYYFWIIASEMSVTRAAEKLKVSQSNLSEQLKEFELQMGAELFERTGRTIQLSEAGRVAFDYANSIFTSGQEMVDLFRNRPVNQRKDIIRIGAISSLSKNLQFEFARSLLRDPEVKLVMVEADLVELIRQLQAHSLDLVISNTPGRASTTPEVFNHRLGQVQVSFVGHPKFKKRVRNLGSWLAQTPLFLPSRAGRFRSDFDSWIERERLSIQVKAEIEDMALLRLFALSGEGVALVPEIVVQRELLRGELAVIQSMPDFFESFFAITTSRRFPNPKLQSLVRAFASQKLSRVS